MICPKAPDIKAVEVEEEEAYEDVNQKEDEYVCSSSETDNDKEPSIHRMFDTKAEVVKHTSGCNRK